MLTDKEKLSRLDDLGDLIKIYKKINGEELNQQIKSLITVSLHAVDECNESWCDSCPVKNALGCICSDVL